MKNKKLRSLLILPLLLVAFGGTVTACDDNTVITDGTYYKELDKNFVNYAFDGSVKLGLDYKGKDFLTDGIAQVDVYLYIDGDTTHFTQKGSTTDDVIKARYYGIDTPESTGKVEKWGKEASIFTQSVLEKAKTIVVSTAQDTYAPPETDSTGSRYVSLVWVNFEKENAPYDELVLLNLMIVQYGLSWVKNVNSMPQYQQTFYDAQNQAEKYELCLWDKDAIPPHWPGDEYQYVSLFEMQEEIKKDLASREANGGESTYVSPLDNQRVLFEGTVAGYVNNTMYLVDYYDIEWLEDYYESIGEDCPYTEGQWAGVNIFCGMGGVPSKYTVTNTYLEMYGLFGQSDNYGFQINDVQGRFPRATSYSTEDTRIQMTAAENNIPAVDGGHMLDVVEYSYDELSAIAASEDRWDYLCRRVAINEPVEVKSVTVSSSNNIYLYFDDHYNSDLQVEVTFLAALDPEFPNTYFETEEDWLNQEFYFSGNLTFHITSSGNLKLQIMPNSNDDIIWVPKESSCECGCEDCFCEDCEGCLNGACTCEDCDCSCHESEGDTPTCGCGCVDCTCEDCEGCVTGEECTCEECECECHEGGQVENPTCECGCVDCTCEDCEGCATGEECTCEECECECHEGEGDTSSCECECTDCTCDELCEGCLEGTCTCTECTCSCHVS
ncbi:MAG: thermonuclease family protein [Coprobacillus sp.]|nr:thermonuclease family protein [Coprobacillus sp.]